MKSAMEHLYDMCREGAPGELTPEMKEKLNMYKARGCSDGALTYIRMALETGLDAEVLAKPEYPDFVVWQLYNGLKDGINLIRFADEGYDWYQIQQIYLGKRAGLDTSSYEFKSLEAEYMQATRVSLELENTKDLEVRKRA